MRMPNEGNEVIASTSLIVDSALDVAINNEALKAFADTLRGDSKISPVPWEDCECHLIVDISSQEGAELTALFVLLLDCMNFCFWPAHGFEYEHLAKGVKWALTGPLGSKWRSMSELSKVSAADICSWFNRGNDDSICSNNWSSADFPLIEERARLVREVAVCLQEGYDGSALNLAESAGGSALKLMRILAMELPGFRDQAIDSQSGQQVFFYKRAQICVADMWGAFRRHGQPIREKLDFCDMPELTMFPDYRVPQILRHKGILTYSVRLGELVDSRKELPAGDRLELEIRALRTLIDPKNMEETFDGEEGALKSSSVSMLLHFAIQITAYEI
ncbi:hypothetical protein FOL47_009634 [Perkinsus chesapeaki]|uniref:Queuosine 5'-phosphate N-glycosylase/hydrolase n=1 Tax=Perkinsus chesapeaki TaxID=330153 RepID=A0A7J6L737_PERCH|nr:hypothetical protein FOL47_009634 [Perkinsus chesapeaki]